MGDAKKHVICAIDTNDTGKAAHLAGALRDHVGAVKLGLEFFTANGVDGVRQITEQKVPVFLDLKFHDIPNTVAGAIRSAVLYLDVFMMTLHVSGGVAMMKSAVDAAEETAWRLGKKKPLLVGVTLLTSLDTQDLRDTGIITPITDHILKLAQLAKDAGLDGVVCPSFEIEAVKNQCGKNFKVVVPGIRPAGSEAGDQKRIMTPQEALEHGADYIVIGRPITKAENPVEAAKQIIGEIKTTKSKAA